MVRPYCNGSASFLEPLDRKMYQILWEESFPSICKALGTLCPGAIHPTAADKLLAENSEKLKTQLCAFIDAQVQVMLMGSSPSDEEAS